MASFKPSIYFCNQNKYFESERKAKSPRKKIEMVFHVEGIENPQAPENGVILVFLKVNMVEK